MLHCTYGRIFYVAAALIATSAGTLGQSIQLGPQDTLAGPKHVLVIHSFGRDYAPYKDVFIKFRTQLARDSTRPVEFLDTSLAMARFDGPDHEQPLLDYLSAVYPDSPPDLIVPIGAQAGLFALSLRKNLFPTAPMLLLATDRRRLADFVGPGIAVVGYDADLTQFLREILQVRPMTREVYFVTGQSPLEQFWERAIIQEWSRFAEEVKVHSLKHLSLDQIADTVATLPPNAAVWVGITNLDAAGVPHEAGKVMQVLHERSGAPLFGYSENQLGQGIVGGSLFPLGQIGETGAGLAIRILAGERPEDIPTVILPLNPPTYDWRELKRWNISAELLPPNHQVMHREPSLWEQHSSIILLVAIVLTTQTGLVILLLAARRRARSSDARLSIAADAANIGLWNRHPNSSQFIVSSRCRELLGFPPDLPLDLETVFARFHPNDRPQVQLAIDQAAQHGHGFALETRIELSDGRIRWLALHGRTHQARNGEGYGTNGAVLDITERKDAEAQAEDHRQERAHLSRVSSFGALSGAIAHELTQPLGSILHNAQAIQNLLQQADPSLEEIQEILDDIVSEDRRASDVIQRLRDLLRRGEIKFETIDLNQQIDEVLRLLRGDLQRREIEVLATLAEGPTTIEADRVQIQQVLINLITNAGDAMELNPSRERRLELSSTVSDGQIAFEVRDHGTGIPADTESLFEPFQTTKPNGLGIGLVICRTLVSAHGGSLHAQNHPAGGALFTVRLPRPTPSP